MSGWSANYNAAAKKQVNYQSIGSGGGIAQIKAANVDFGTPEFFRWVDSQWACSKGGAQAKQLD